MNDYSKLSDDELQAALVTASNESDVVRARAHAIRSEINARAIAAKVTAITDGLDAEGRAALKRKLTELDEPTPVAESAEAPADAQ